MTTKLATEQRTRLGTDASLVDVLDRVLDRGVVVAGDITLSVAGVDLVYVNLRLLIKGVDDEAPDDRAIP